jgi:ABC-type antimicrobial peptide transport system permease subunit
VFAAAVPGLVLAVAGVAIGLVAARLAARTMAHVVWGVTVGDPVTFAMAAGVVLIVTAIATLVPAVRIARLNPIKALRQT